MAAGKIGSFVICLYTTDFMITTITYDTDLFVDVVIEYY